MAAVSGDLDSKVDGALTKTRHARRDTGPVLLCHDGSDHANRAVRSAGALLRPTRAAVVHVRDAPLAEDVAEAGRRIALDAGFDAVAVVEAGRGPVASVVLEEAHARDVSVIVVGARGRTPARPPLLGSVSSALLHDSDVPLLVVGPRAPQSPGNEPIFVCYDGSPIARAALATAAELLTGRAATVACFMPLVDDVVVLRATLPWPAGGDMQDRLARLDRQEAEAPARRAAEGAGVAAAAGFAARPVGISAADASNEEQEQPWQRLLRAAAVEAAACNVVAHRAFVHDPASAAHALVHHADRPVLVIPSGRGGDGSESLGVSRHRSAARRVDSTRSGHGGLSASRWAVLLDARWSIGPYLCDPRTSRSTEAPYRASSSTASPEAA